MAQCSDFELVRTFDRTAVAPVDIVARTRPHLVIIASRTPAAALGLLSRLHACFPSTALLELMDTDQPVVVAELLRAGATGVAQPTQSVRELLDAMRVSMRGSRYVPPDIASGDVERALIRSPLGALTRREYEIFLLLGQGYSNQAISQRLFISHRTTETHRQRIMHKLGLRSIVQLVRLATDLELPAASVGDSSRLRPS